MNIYQNDPTPPAAESNDMKFDDINLDDDKAVPKLDLDFGLNEPAANEKKSGGGFSFGGGWGGGWGSTGTSWGFGGSEEKTETKVDDSWNFGAGKKDKKKNDGFDFNFDTVGGEGDDLGLGSKKDEPEADPW